MDETRNPQRENETHHCTQCPGEQITYNGETFTVCTKECPV